ncbi:DUF177 domain-containing protein [Phaeobacter sp. B1627]|uniref:YceD family protein n=1 Tax=Phaeobacter sp. B1627 TaxID=2583809 RepID=UPI00111A02CE|nr:DUF177 domain-containing protein [Phaeobacter sp. B1627]TNJ44029.1 DUF177 domain-containing protein [Phaeobacter sp. B1627]
MSSAPSSPTALRVADLPQNRPTRFALVPESSELTEIARELGVETLRKLRFEGEISARGKRDWALKGKLGFTVVQPCVVTLEPVTTRIDTPVERLFLARIDTPEEEEVEMSEDDHIDPLGEEIDPYLVMVESVALHLPQYPRKDGAELGQHVHAEPGTAPMTDEDTRPFAGLADLIKPAGAASAESSDAASGEAQGETRGETRGKKPKQ